VSGNQSNSKEMIGVFRIQYPDWRFHSIADISINELLARGIRAVLVDLDNTCAERKLWFMTAEAAAWISKAREAGIVVVIVSNTVTGGRRIDRVRKIAADNSVSFVCARFPRLKPNPFPYREALRIAGVDKSQAAMVGDQLFTDIVGANRAGIEMAILVDPVDPSGDHWATKPRRWLQNWVMRGRGYTN
jgi:HAD superfamily phosphatase (TIGR01668 family)